MTGGQRCERHGLAAGPDGRCALCHRRERAISRALSRGRDRWRTAAIVLVAIAAAVAVFSLTGAWLDTKPGP
jgi:hypothetical protein